ncbi:MAG: hypothetical protein KA746_11850 [Pyrinomonadaceae bacterium]|nr:hypothetical protein [Pyrinomonadaceae bacterium]MBP6211686.1 hypothetical protein [Pyrinomonadaceae bacterium]
MKIPSDEIPQADVLEDVVRTVICIANGGQTFQDIAATIGKVERQGRYYRKAAEILGFIITPTRNHSVLTPVGQEFVQNNPSVQHPTLLGALLSARVFQRIIPFLELNNADGVTRDNIVDFIVSVADITTDSMAPRRFSSVVAWLEAVEMVTRRGDRFFLSSALINKKVPILEFTDVDEPILPRTTDLSEYEAVAARANKARKTIVTYRDQVATERADNAHRHLVNLVAKRIKGQGSIPRYNYLIDLATRFADVDYIFEMKSLTEANTKSQMRSGLSQLYEYRYLQNLPNAQLVMVVERKPSPKFNWMIDYLQSDHNILTVWDGDDRLFGNKRTQVDMAFLGVEAA